jgi:coniferyl-aldehyde dehydrogenase
VPLAGIIAAGNRAMVKMSENLAHLAKLLIWRNFSSSECRPNFLPEKLQFFSGSGRPWR